MLLRYMTRGVQALVDAGYGPVLRAIGESQQDLSHHPDPRLAQFQSWTWSAATSTLVCRADSDVPPAWVGVVRLPAGLADVRVWLEDNGRSWTALTPDEH